MILVHSLCTATHCTANKKSIYLEIVIVFEV